MRRLNNKTPESNSPKKIFKFAKIAAVIVIALISLEVLMVNRLSTYGNKIQQLKNSQAGLELENQVLENQIAQNTALNSLEKKANELGFDSIKNVEYLKSLSIASAR